MNYLLVMPKKLSTGASTTSIIFPLGIAYVSGALKQAGCSVTTANLDFPERETSSALQELLSENNIDVVCTGGLSLDFHKIKDVIDSVRRINPEIITVVGGGIVSSDPEPAMQALDADIGVIGEGERTICELAHALDNGKTYSNIPGLIYRDSNDVLTRTSRRKEIADIDNIPFPDFEGFNYAQWVDFHGGAGVLLSDRSCPFHCTFCFHPTGEKYRQRSIGNIFKELDYQMRRYRLKSIGLTSELFATSKHRVFEFCDRIKDYKIAWSCCLRVSDVDANLLERMKESGCNLICYGLESADNSILKSMRKGINVDQIKRALDITYDVGISTEASNFIFGDINETAETVANTLSFWRQYNKKTHINLNLIQTYPGTHLYDYACQNGIIRDKEQFLRDGCPIINVSKLNSPEFHTLTSSMAELRLHPHVPAESLKITEIEDNGNCRIEYICRKCGAVNSISSWFWFTTTCHCSSCSIKNEVDPFREASCRQDAFFANLPVDAAIALWGAGGIYYKLVNSYSGLFSERFLLIDGNLEQHGLSICKKIVNSPDAIDRNNIRTVIITALSRKEEIHQALSNDHPSVENVLAPGIDIRPNAIVPVLKTFQPIQSKECKS
jgi:radical SAM superfamily enzyme YgiQ (UPF0313 family)